MRRTIFLLTLLAAMVGLAMGHSTQDEESLYKFPPRTALSKKAINLQLGMTRKQVINLLGLPTWAQSYTGMPLDWIYRNGNCNPVDVTFNETNFVTGFDQGRALCLKTTFVDSLPEDKTLCSNPDNRSLCGP